MFFLKISLKNCFLRSLLKIVFCPYIRKSPNSKKRYFSLDPFENIVFLSICQNINISRKKIIIYFEITLKKIFWSIYPKISTFRKKLRFSESTSKIVFCPYIRKYQHFEKNYIILRIKENFFLMPIYPTISTFREKLHYFEITFNNSLFDHIAKNISISRKISFFRHNF